VGNFFVAELLLASLVLRVTYLQCENQAVYRRIKFIGFDAFVRQSERP
jgi:hypothetical protein